MPESAIVDSVIALGNPSITFAGFGIPVAFATLTAPQDAAFPGGALTFETTAGAFDAELATLGVTASDLAYKAIAALYSDPERKPERAVLARRAAKVQQLVTYTVTGTTDGTYGVVIDGTPFTHVASSETLTQIRDGLVTALAALPASPPLTVAPVSTDQFTIQADTAGIPFTTAIDGGTPGAPDLSQVVTTPSVGITEDIAAVFAERNDMYWAGFVDRSDLEIPVIARALETRSKLSHPLTADAVANTAATTDPGAIVNSENLTRTRVFYDTSTAVYPDFALAGRMLPTIPGSANWTSQEIVGGGPGIELASSDNLLAKGYLWLERFAGAGFAMTQEGKGSGVRNFTDLIRGRDWLDDQIIKRVLAVFKNEDKIGFDQAGIDKVTNGLRAALQEGVDSGLVLAGSIKITPTPLESTDPAERAVRKYDRINWTATLRGAINSVTIRGTLTP